MVRSWTFTWSSWDVEETCTSTAYSRPDPHGKPFLGIGAASVLPSTTSALSRLSIPQFPLHPWYRSTVSTLKNTVDLALPVPVTSNVPHNTSEKQAKNRSSTSRKMWDTERKAI